MPTKRCAIILNGLIWGAAKMSAMGWLGNLELATPTQVEKDFQEKQRLLPDGSLFAVFNESLSLKEKEALTFLYAYMPIGDLTDYEGDLYLRSVRSTFKAQQEMRQGDSNPRRYF